MFDLFLHLSKTAGIPWLAKYEHEIRGGLKEPGMLARKIHELSAWLADGREGVIRCAHCIALHHIHAITTIYMHMQTLTNNSVLLLLLLLMMLMLFLSCY